MLRDEELTHAPKAKKCSFTTSRPALWAKVIENHLREVVNPYFSSKYKSYDSQYLEYTLHFNGDENKKVTINIYVKTGVILVQGEHYQHWAEKVFPKLKEQVLYNSTRGKLERTERKRTSSVHSGSCGGLSNKARSKSVGNLTLMDDGVISGPTSPRKAEVVTENSEVGGCSVILNDMGGVGYLWKENVNLKAALQKLERDYESLTGELENVHLRSRSQVKAIDKVYTKVLLEDETCDPVVDEEKVTTSCEETSAETTETAEVTSETVECGSHVESRSKLIADSAWKLESQISEMKDRLHGKITDIRQTLGGVPPFCRCHVWNDLAKIQSHIAGVQQLIITDIDDLKERVGKIESGFESLTSHVIPSHADGLKRLEGDHQTVVSNVEEMKNGLEEMRRKMLIAWGENDPFRCETCPVTL